MLTEILEKVARQENLTADQMAAAVGIIIDRDCEESQIAGLLMALRVKGETVEEMVGAARVFRQRAIRLPFDGQPDLCTAGTGGDRRGTINLSTAAALIAASAGASVAKHGNRSVSSRCGSADVLRAMGVDVDLTPVAAARQLQSTGFTFLFAPHYHPAMKAVAPVRQALRVRTLFNFLGPLTNPAGVRAQLAGVFHPSRVRFVAEAFAGLGMEHALVVSAECGLDEISPEGETHIAEVREGNITEFTIRPEHFGLASAPLSSIRGGDPDGNARVIRAVLEGEPLPARTGIVMNAAAALYIAGRVENFREGALLAEELIDSGQTGKTLSSLIVANRKAA